MKILLVCDFFPPALGLRMGYLCKYLRAENVEVDVVCQQHDEDRCLDMLCGYAKNVKYLELYRWKSGIKHKAEWGITVGLTYLFSYKDRRLARLVKRDPSMRGYDLVLCSTFTTFPLKAARMLARHFKIPLVADLRDIVEEVSDKWYLSKRISDGCVGRALEAAMVGRQVKQRNRVLSHAACVTTISPWHVEFLSRYNPNTKLIYNGFDPELFFPQPVSDPVFRMVFTGRILSLALRDPALLLEAVAGLSQRGEIEPESFRLEWYTDRFSQNILQELAQKFKVEEFMYYSPYIPAREIPGLLNRSSILIQLANKAGTNAHGPDEGPKGIMTTKIFEALAVCKPMLLVRSDESYLADLIKRYDCGLAATQVKEVEEFILQQLSVFKQKGYTRVEHNPQQASEIEALYSRKGQALKFLGVFQEVISQKR